MRNLLILIALVLSIALLAGAGDGSYRGGSYDVAGGSYVGTTVPATYDTVTLAIVTSDTFTFADAGVEALVGSADQVLVIGEDVPEFAWAMIDRDNPAANVPDFSECWYRAIMQNAGNGTWNQACTSRSGILMYADWNRYIPDNSTLVLADLYLTPVFDAYYTYEDTVCVTLMDAATTGVEWWKSRGVWANSANVDTLKYHAHATWDNAVQGRGTQGFPAVTIPWAEDRDTLLRYWDYGPIADWTGYPAVTFVPSNTAIPVDMRNCVQSVVNGEDNYGFWISDMDQAATGLEKYFFHWGNRTSVHYQKTPVIYVKYITKRYRTRFPEGDFAFVFSTDDIYKATNDSLSALFAEFGDAYTINVLVGQVGNAGRCGWSDLFGYFDLGMELGSHTISHANLDQITANETMDATGWYPGAPLSACVTANDTMLYQLDPEVFHVAAFAVKGDRLDGHPRLAKTMAFPSGRYDHTALIGINTQGYIGGRSTVLNPVAESLPRRISGWNRVPYDSPAVKPDSLWAGLKVQNPLGPTNLVGWSLTTYAYKMFGVYSDTTITEAAVRNAVRGAVNDLIASHRYILSTYFHTTKEDTLYNDGAETEEMRDALSEIHILGGDVMTFGELCGYMQANGVAVDYNSFTAADAMYYQLNGLDGTFFRR